ncbi:MAG: caspase family protein [Chloroflexaceae bacterium]|nr:caspase family protein [Chloroflexaceae bacterium]
MKALFIGNNDYIDAPLHACVNDAAAMALLLKSFGYADITILRNATRTEMEFGLRWLAQGTGRKWLHYSGHGTWARAGIDYDKDGQEEDCFIPIDWRTSGIVGLSALHHLFDSLDQQSRLTCTLDTCHSGSITRDDMFLLAPYAAPRFQYVSPLSWEQVVLRRAQQRQPAENTILLAACKASETAREIRFPDGFGGLFTRSLLTSLQPGKTYAEVVKAVQEYVAQTKYEQTPQLNCAERWLHEQIG